MKTWEMIKELTENPEKKFKNHIGNVVGVIDDCLVLNPNTVKSYSFNLEVDEKWEEVIETVDFLTAYKDCLENGNDYKCVDKELDDQTMKRLTGTVEVYCDKEDNCVQLTAQWIKVAE